MKAKIAKWGNSAAMRLPAATLAAAGLAIGDEVDVAVEGGEVRLRRPRRVLTIEELFAEHERKYGPLDPPKLVDWGPDRGAEIVDEDWSDIAPTDEEMGIAHGASRRANSRRR